MSTNEAGDRISAPDYVESQLSGESEFIQRSFATLHLLIATHLGWSHFT